MTYIDKARIFLLVDLWDFFRFRVGGGGGYGGRKKSSENDQLTGHLQSFFFNISRTTVKLAK